MKTLVIIVFTVLVAAVVAVGAFFGVSNYYRSREIIEKKHRVEAEVALLRFETSSYNSKPEATNMLMHELDSISNTITSAEENLKEILGRRGMLSRQPNLRMNDIRDEDALKIYPFTLIIEGRHSAIDTFLLELHDELPLMLLDSLEAIPGFSSYRLKIWGVARFPRNE
jgi:hypothetical protein